MPRLEFESPRDYFNHFQRLVRLEREEEIRFYMEEIRRLPGWKRERLGRAILGLRAKFEGEGLGGRYLYRLMKIPPSPLPDTEISPGDVVLVSRGNPLRESLEATVVEKRSHSLLLALDERLPRWRGDLRVDLYVSETTFDRMLAALRAVLEGRNRFPTDVLLGKGEVSSGSEPFEPENKLLNQAERTAVSMALGSGPVFMVHGPPGTGKTVTAAEIVVQLVRRGYKVLATADSNIAVDNLLERLIGKVRAVRIGHPARVIPSLRDRSLDVIVERSPEYEEVRRLREEAARLREEQEKLLRPSPSRRRGFSDEQIMRLARVGRGSRGLSAEELKSMAAWLSIQRLLDSIYGRISKIVERLVNDILGEADVVCATNSGVGSELLHSMQFDVAVVDEATQSTEPSTLIPVHRVEKAVLIGDHRQLPPTILSMRAKRDLELTMFERMIKLYPHASTMLRVQYRMNEKIMEFPNRRFYGGLLEAHESVRNIVLSEITSRPTRYPAILDDEPLVFVDTGGHFPESQRRGSTSRENVGEAEAVARIVRELLEMGVRPQDIGVITPYDDQVSRIRSLLPVEGLEVKSVDGFQGREKEVIVLSFVRSNPEGEVGFLMDERRLNVAITRAKRKLIMIGDSKTLSRHPLYRELVEHVASRGRVVRWMGFPT